MWKLDRREFYGFSRGAESERWHIPQGKKKEPIALREQSALSNNSDDSEVDLSSGRQTSSG